jgi:NAD(P)H-dependent FMN reductase
MNRFFNPRLLFGPLQPAVDAAADGIQQFQPVFQRRVGDGLPLFKTPVAHKELPAVADMLRVNLDPLALVGTPLPTDLSLGHSLLFRAVNARHRHGRDSFFAPDESQQLVGRGLDADAVHIDLEGGRDIHFHLFNMRRNLRLLRDDGGVHVDDSRLAELHLSGGFLQENAARNALPARIGVGEKMTDVRLAQRAEHRITNRVHENVGIRVAVETFRVRNFHAAQNELAPLGQLVNVITYAHVNHRRNISATHRATKQFVEPWTPAQEETHGLLDRASILTMLPTLLRRISQFDIPGPPCYSQFMSETTLNILAVIGSLHSKSVTRTVIRHAAKQLEASGCSVDTLDFEKEPLALYNPDTAHEGAVYSVLRERVERADVILLGTPDYHGSISGAMKNFLDHFWREFAGKLFATIVASHEKGLTATDQLRTVARQCYAWTLPYGVSFAEDHDVKNGKIASNALKQRLEMLTRDTRVYGQLLAKQRREDLRGAEPGFMARHR